ncbi:hypothetical protein [Soonwooa sp.]|uniref:hypothetical protein n=3 Tax=Soonwooa sp. TaxID=1938592 RepID=UPI0028A2B23D|nr:hypothetical protein [Soonwooa sp.]
MSRLALLLIVIPTLVLSQSRKKKALLEEMSFSIEPNVRVMKAIGDNSMNKALSPFVGFGLGGILYVYKNFGLTAEYNYMTANLNQDNQGGLFGYMSAATMHNVEFSGLYKHNISEAVDLEGLAGASIYRVSSKFIDKGGKFNEGNSGFHIGGKILYTLDREGVQQVVFGTKLNYYTASIRNQNPDIEKFYSKAWFLNFSAAYRINF